MVILNTMEILQHLIIPSSIVQTITIFSGKIIKKNAPLLQAERCCTQELPLTCG